MQVKFLTVSVFLLSTLLIGCNNAESTTNEVAENKTTLSNQSPEQLVRERSEVRLKALLDKDFDVAYALTSPGYQTLKDITGFKQDNLGVVSWSEAKVTKVSCEEKTCIVNIDVTYSPTGLSKPSMMGQTITTTLAEQWIYTADNWWYASRK